MVKLGHLKTAIPIVALGAGALLVSTSDLMWGSDGYERVPEFEEAAVVLKASPDAPDGTAGSLRWAIDQAGDDGIPTVIDLGGGVFVLDGRCEKKEDDENAVGDLDTSADEQDLLIRGDGAQILQFCAERRVLHHRGTGTLKLSGVIVRLGEAVAPFGDGRGGGLLSDSGATVIVENSVFQDNSAESSGGALFISGSNARALIRNSSIVGNKAESGGGGATVLGKLDVLNSTVANNKSGTHGAVTASDVSLIFATIADNTALDSVDGRQIGARKLESLASVVTGGSGTLKACDVEVTESMGWNFGDDRSCGFGSGTGDVDSLHTSQLGALTVYSGHTFSRPPALKSPVINVVPTSVCKAQAVGDQMGSERPSGAFCDAGAVELTLGMKPLPYVAAPSRPASPTARPVNYTG